MARARARGEHGEERDGGGEDVAERERCGGHRVRPRRVWLRRKKEPTFYVTLRFFRPRQGPHQQTRSPIGARAQHIKSPLHGITQTAHPPEPSACVAGIRLEAPRNGRSRAGLFGAAEAGVCVRAPAAASQRTPVLTKRPRLQSTPRAPATRKIPLFAMSDHVRGCEAPQLVCRALLYTCRESLLTSDVRRILLMAVLKSDRDPKPVSITPRSL